MQRASEISKLNVPAVAIWQEVQQQSANFPGVVTVMRPWGSISFDVHELESLSCRVARITVNTDQLDVESCDQFFQRAKKLVERINCRLFPLELLELDTMTPAFQARSPRRGLIGESEGTPYYELAGTPQQISLRRFSKRLRGERLPDHFTLTQEMVNAFADAVAQSLVTL
ncbi:MAG: hypothetical protein O2931_07995 [Planctomycetota bacterium]|nr:hypothetical protein [Planctomycetota bacterium]MDA1178722.1 hypothetical protein [Planctomycetota bacterium]